MTFLIFADVFELRVGCGFKEEGKPRTFFFFLGAAPFSVLLCSLEGVWEPLK